MMRHCYKYLLAASLFALFQSAAGHDLRMGIMNKYPTDRKKRYRVYDSKGNLMREEGEP